MKKETKENLKHVGLIATEILIKGLPNYILTNLNKNNQKEVKNNKG